MHTRVENYMKYVEKMLSQKMNPEEKEEFLQSFLIQLSFYQHERIIHLLVTLTFAIISIVSLAFVFSTSNIFLFAFSLGSLIFLFFYVKHYFFLERSVQKMYTYYDQLVEPEIFTENIIEP